MHSGELQKKCRLCVGDLGDNTFKYSVSNVWINDYLIEELKDEKPNFDAEDKTQFPKFICKVCFNKMYHHKSQFEKHRKSQVKIPKSRRTEFTYSGGKVTIATEEDFKHGENNDCKVCGNNAPLEEEPEEPHVDPSPGTYKRKDASPMLTPKSKRADIRKQGTAKRTLEFEKTEHMNVDSSDEDIELNIKSTIGTKVASDRETVKEENIKDKSVAKVFNCSICGKLPRSIVKLNTCNHMFCFTCIYEWRSVSTKCVKCSKVFNEGNILRLHEDMLHVHESLEVRCRKKGCLKEFNLHKLSDHENVCHARSATIKSKLGTFLGDHKHKDRVEERIKVPKKELKVICKETEEDETDVLFSLLASNLKEREIKLKDNVEELHKLYIKDIHEVEVESNKKLNAEQSTALKTYTNMSATNVVKLNRFNNENETNSSMASYPKILECEKELDVGNVSYKLINKETKTESKVHEKTTEDPTIPLEIDIGHITGDIINVPADGVRINIQDGISKGLEMIYPEILHEVSEKYPKLCLTDHILVAHVKTCLDGTLDESTHRKSTDRTEVDHWLPGTYSILQIDILFQDGTRAMLWKEKDPNSILSNPPFALYKADEGNKASLSYLLNAHEKEVEQLKTNYLDIDIEVKKEDIKRGNEIEKDLNMEAQMMYEDKTYDEVMKQETLEEYKGNKTKVPEDELEKETLKQRFEVRVTRTVDEKLSRILHGRAAAGSSRPCVCCNLSRGDCKLEVNWGTQEVTQTSRLEKEIASFCLDNTQKLSKKQLESIAQGMRSKPITSVEPKEEIPDNLHFKINLSEYLFTIQKRIVAYENTNKQPVYDNVAANKENNHQADLKLMKYYQNKIKTLPKSKEQNPGKFAREYLDPKNRNIVLEPMAESEEKTKFANLMKAMDPVREIVDKTEPSVEDRAQISNYSKALQSAMAEFTWVQNWPNQFIRLTHHAGSFLNDPHGIGAIQPYGSEALEAANSWLKRYDRYFTYRGDRKKAIRTVFKMRYLKSCYKLRKYIPVTEHGKKKCSSCGLAGHQRNSRFCMSRETIDLEEEGYNSE